MSDCFVYVHPDRTDVLQDVEFAYNNVGRLESELEIDFLLCWVGKTFGCGSTIYGDRHLTRGPFSKPTPFFRLRSQQQIGDFRVDFRLDVLTASGATAASAVIETDGFAFHSDRESFETDRMRDAVLLSQGFPVFRYTWRMIHDHRDPLGPIIAWSRKVRPL